MWVLIFVMWTSFGSGGGGVTTQEFTSPSACDAAGRSMQLKLSEAYISSRWICTAK